jgi:hypothetical protein
MAQFVESDTQQGRHQSKDDAENICEIKTIPDGLQALYDTHPRNSYKNLNLF